MSYQTQAAGFLATLRRSSDEPPRGNGASSGSGDGLRADAVRELGEQPQFRREMYAQGFSSGIVDAMNALNGGRRITAEVTLLVDELANAHSTLARNHAKGRLLGFLHVVDGLLAELRVHYPHIPDHLALAERLGQREPS